MNANEHRSGGLSALAPSLLTALVLTFVLIALCAFIVLHQELPDTTIAPLALGCMGVGAWAAALLTARHCPTNRFVMALCGGMSLYACMIVLSLSWVGMPIDPLRMAIGAGVALLASALGGILGSKRKKRRKYK